MTPPKPAAVLFDLDGTLIDSVHTLRDATNRLLAELGREPLDLEAMRRFIGDGPAKMVHRALDATGGAPAQERERLVERFMDIYERRPTDGTVPFDGVRAGLEALGAQAVKLAVCTNKPERATRLILSELRLMHHFTAIVGGDTLPEKKPSPMPVLELCRRLDAAPSEVWFVGDNEHDVSCARAAGVARVFLMRYGYSRHPLDELDHDGLLDSLEELSFLIGGRDLARPQAEEAPHLTA